MSFYASSSYKGVVEEQESFYLNKPDDVRDFMRIGQEYRDQDILKFLEQARSEVVRDYGRFDETLRLAREDGQKVYGLDNTPAVRVARVLRLGLFLRPSETEELTAYSFEGNNRVVLEDASSIRRLDPVEIEYVSKQMVDLELYIAVRDILGSDEISVGTNEAGVDLESVRKKINDIKERGKYGVQSSRNRERLRRRRKEYRNTYL